MPQFALLYVLDESRCIDRGVKSHVEGLVHITFVLAIVAIDKFLSNRDDKRTRNIRIIVFRQQAHVTPEITARFRDIDLLEYS